MFVCVAMALFGVMASVQSRTSVQVQVASESKAQEPKKVENSIFMPDFAFPADVKSTALAFLQANPASMSEVTGSHRLLAIEELSTAELSIDRKAIAKVLGTLMQCADSEPNAATRAMLHAYAASLCSEMRYVQSGSIDTPAPDKIDLWSYMAFNLAADSLYTLAYTGAPEGAPLKAYNAALSPYVGDLASTVRDFVTLLWTDGFKNVNDRNRMAVNGLTELSPMWFYYKTVENSTYPKHREFIRQHIGEPNVGYAVIPYLSKVEYDRDREANYAFFQEVAKADIPVWLKPYVDDQIKYLKSEYWTLSFSRESPVGKPVKATLFSVNTRSLTISLYRFDSMPASYMSSKKLSAQQPYRTTVFNPESGMSLKVDSLSFDLPAGYYCAMVRGGGKDADLLGSPFTVTPWSIVALESVPKECSVQVLDYMTGLAQKGLTVRAQYYDKRKTKWISGVTDARGVVKFKVNDISKIEVSDPRGKFVYSPSGGSYVRCGWRNDYDDDDDDEDDDYTLDLTTDRAMYRPGDEVCWVGVFQNSKTTLKGRKENIAVRWPAERGKKSDETKLSMPASDEFGRVEGRFVVPKDVEPGIAYISAKNGSHSFIISDFKLPELNIRDTGYTLHGDSVTLRGYVVNSVEAPVTGSEVTLKIALKGDSIFTRTVPTDAKGQYSFKVLRNINDNDGSYIGMSQNYTVEAVSPSGYNATERLNYPVFKDVSLSLKCENSFNVAEGMTFQIDTERLGCDNPKEPVECEWILIPDKQTASYSLDGRTEYLHQGLNAASKYTDSLAVLSGRAMTGKVTLTAAMTDSLPAGRYYVSMRAVDMTGDVAYKQITLYNTANDRLPEQKAIWLPKTGFEVTESQKTSVIIGAADNLTLWMLNKSTGKTSQPTSVRLKKGYNTLEFDRDDAGTVCLWAMKDGLSGSATLEIKEKTPENKFTVAIETFRDRVSTGEREHWTLVTRYNDKPVRAAVMLNVYDQRLTYFGRPVPLYIRQPDVRSTTFVPSMRFVSNDRYGVSVYHRATRGVLVSDLRNAIQPEWKYLSLYRVNDLTKSRSVGVVTDNALALGGAKDLAANGRMCTVSGRVVDETGEPMPGVVIVVKGGISGQTTDINGEFVMNVPKDVTLVFSYVGYGTQQVDVTGNESITVMLDPSDQVLNDMVVSGYGTFYSSSGTILADATTVAMVEQAPMPAGAIRGLAVKTAEASDEAGAQALESVAIREGTILNALWSPLVTTDAATGQADIDWVLPNQTSTWVVDAKAWTTDLKTATLNKTFTAIKPLYIKPNMPRFVRVGDCVNVVTAITNATDTAQHVVYDVTIGSQVIKGNIDIPGNATRYVTAPIRMEGALALADTLDLTFRAGNGSFGDGERVAIPVLPSSALVVESRPFYLNADQSDYAVTVPHTDGEVEKTEFHFTANPMWTVVEALPSVLDELDDMQKVATYYAQAWYAARTARVIAESHAPAKDVIDVKKASQMEKKALTELKKLQMPDGGFTWGAWSHVSSVGTTLAVLSWFDQDTDDKAISSLVEKALKYVDNNILPPNTTPASNFTYALIRGRFGKPTTASGAAVVKKTLEDIRKNWKKLSLDGKSRAASILALNDENRLAAQVLRSVSQFGVATDDRGLVFPEMPGLVAYTNMLEAFYAVTPDSTRLIDSVRQALVCLRRGANWGSTAHTAYAVRAMVMGGTDWTVPAESVTVRVDGSPVEVPPYASKRGAFSIDVEGREVALTRSAGVPAYGALVTRTVVPLTSVKAFAPAELSITKAIYATDKAGKRVLIENAELAPGQRVVVSLILKANQDMTNIAINDDRPAALEPVDQTGRYCRANSGAWYYVSPRNTQTNIYMDRLPRGNTTVEYEAIINNSGQFTTGVATIVNGEDPDLTAHSASFPFTVPE